MQAKKRQAIAVVTGAARGIGKAIATRLAQCGAQVILADIDIEAGEAVACALRNDGLAAVFQPTDVAEATEIEQLFARVENEYGRLDWLVNNAALVSFKSIDELSLEEFDRMFAVNLRAYFATVKLAVPLLRKASSAAIVNIASTRALMSEVNNEAYASMKAGVLGLTHALANSLGPAIRVNAVSPGWIDTSQGTVALTAQDHAQHPVGRVGMPEDIAELTAFLLSNESGFISGQNIVADGGMTKKMIYHE
ncbi:SDR family oxidoreductase [Azotosporobacter soli]|uniref:SDR family oxidoreductase n=1 Tax=Azotosporobacter soli TaxID=3055040 RepID=UPI0031FE4F11